MKLFVHVRHLFLAFMDKELTLFAASLSFYTLFAFIPFLLILMTALTSSEIFMELYEKIKEIIFDNLLPVNSEVVMRYIDEFLKNSVHIGLFSTSLFLLSSVFFFQNYEYIANKIFHAPQRTPVRSLGVYLLMLVLTPLSLMLAFFLSTNFASFILPTNINFLPLIPYLLIWLLFFMLFKLSANIYVYFGAALWSSLFVSIVFSIAKSIFIYYVFVNQSYNTIYGSFAVLVFLFLWIYISWIVFIFGLKLCYFVNRVYQRKDAKQH